MSWTKIPLLNLLDAVLNFNDLKKKQDQKGSQGMRLVARGLINYRLMMLVFILMVIASSCDYHNEYSPSRYFNSEQQNSILNKIFDTRYEIDDQPKKLEYYECKDSVCYYLATLNRGILTPYDECFLGTVTNQKNDTVVSHYMEREAVDLSRDSLKILFEGMMDGTLRMHEIYKNQFHVDLAIKTNEVQIETGSFRSQNSLLNVEHKEEISFENNRLSVTTEPREGATDFYAKLLKQRPRTDLERWDRFIQYSLHVDDAIFIHGNSLHLDSVIRINLDEGQYGMFIGFAKAVVGKGCFLFCLYMAGGRTN